MPYDGLLRGGVEVAFAGKLRPGLGQLAAELGNPPLANLELFRRVLSPKAETQVFGDAAVAALQALEPVGEVNAKRDNVRHGSIACIFDDGLLPLALLLIVVVEPFDDDA